MRHLAILLMFGMLVFGCTSNEGAANGHTSTVNGTNQSQNSAPPSEEALTLPPISEGKYCIFSSSEENMACNFDALAVTNENGGFNMSAGVGFEIGECSPVSILLMEEERVIMLFPFGREIIQIDNETNSRMLSRRLMNPCTINEAWANGKPGEGYCFYNSTVKEIECWKNVSFLREGIFHNYTGTPIKVDWCGLTGAYYPDTNESDLIFIWENRDTLFRMDNKTSVQAVATQMAGNNCSS